MIDNNNEIAYCNCHCTNDHVFDPDYVWECRCDCGETIFVCGVCLTKGHVTSCRRCHLASQVIH